MIKKPGKLHTGCGYLLGVTLIACGLLVLNSFLIRIALEAYREYSPHEIAEPRAQQAIQVAMPVLLIFMEYWLYDWCVDRFGSRQSRPSR